MPEITLVFDEKTGIQPVDFVESWNETEETRAVAAARLAPSRAAEFDPSLVETGLMVVFSLASGVASNLLTDLLRKTLGKEGARKRTEVKEIVQPDGTRWLIVTEEES